MSPSKAAIGVSPDYSSKETQNMPAGEASSSVDLAVEIPAVGPNAAESERALGVAERADGAPAEGWPVPARRRSQSACEAHREYIQGALARGRCAKLISQDLVHRHGFQQGYASVMRFARTLRPSSGEREARAVIETAPGEEAGSQNAR